MNQNPQNTGRPADPWAQTRPAQVPQQYPPPQPQYYPSPPAPRRRMGGCCGCLIWPLLGLVGLFFFFLFYLLAPLRINVLAFGIDNRPEENSTVGRSDTMILMSVNPLQPDVRMLSIPRDLWVNIPDVGENRINTAHFFAEASQEGSGPAALLETVNVNFDINVPYYMRVRFDAFQGIVDAMNGVTLTLENDMGGLPAGTHHLDGAQALAFVRDRSGTDDFFRMNQALVMVQAIIRQLLTLEALPRWPAVIAAGLASIDTNLPVWQWPRLGFALVRAMVFNGIDSRTISREMTTPFITEGGADVLLPDWTQIQPLVDEMFR